MAHPETDPVIMAIIEDNENIIDKDRILDIANRLNSYSNLDPLDGLSRLCFYYTALYLIEHEKENRCWGFDWNIIINKILEITKEAFSIDTNLLIDDENHITSHQCRIDICDKLQSDIFSDHPGYTKYFQTTLKEVWGDADNAYIDGEHYFDIDKLRNITMPIDNMNEMTTSLLHDSNDTSQTHIHHPYKPIAEQDMPSLRESTLEKLNEYLNKRSELRIDEDFRVVTNINTGIKSPQIVKMGHLLFICDSHYSSASFACRCFLMNKNSDGIIDLEPLFYAADNDGILLASKIIPFEIENEYNSTAHYKMNERTQDRANTLFDPRSQDPLHDQLKRIHAELNELTQDVKNKIIALSLGQDVDLNDFRQSYEKLAYFCNSDAVPEQLRPSLSHLHSPIHEFRSSWGEVSVKSAHKQ